ncbi:MAG: TIGR04076 family protein [Anaerolineales bacterium]|nr:TIGR04076 family protein [Anaerolineales bacterium]
MTMMMNNNTRTLVVEVVKVQGHCPVFRVGDTFSIKKGHQLVADLPVCMNAIQALSPYYIPLSRGMHPVELGLAGPNGDAYVQCTDPQGYTGGGTVTFRITHDESRLNASKPFQGRMPVRW